MGASENSIQLVVRSQGSSGDRGVSRLTVLVVLDWIVVVLMAGRSAVVRDLGRVEYGIVPDSWATRMGSFAALIDRGCCMRVLESYLCLVLLFLYPYHYL